MDDFKGVLKEINRRIGGVLVFDIILTTVLLFLLCYLALILFRLNPWYGLVPALIYFLFLLYKSIKTNKYRMIEKRYRPLQEKLRTAVDNVNTTGTVITNLEKEVVNDLKKVSISSFIGMRKTSFKLFCCILVCFAILSSSIYNLHFEGFDKAFNKTKNFLYEKFGKQGGGTGYEAMAGDGGEEGDIYGRESVAKIGTKGMELKIKQASLEIVGAGIEETPKKEFDEAFPDEIFATSSSGYEEKIAAENQKLVKNYFKELSKE